MQNDVIQIEAETASLGYKTNENNFVLKQTVSLKKLVNKVIKQNAICETPMLPNNTKFFWQKGPDSLVVIEEAPRLRNMKRAKAKNYYHLAFPYIVYICVLKKDELEYFIVTYRNSPLKSLNDMLYQTNLTNTDTDSTCFGKIKLDHSGSLKDRVEHYIQRFWNSVFTFDLSKSYLEMAEKDKRLKNYKTWQEESQKDPLFILNVDWFVFCTLNRVIDKLVKRRTNIISQGASDIADMIYKIEKEK